MARIARRNSGNSRNTRRWLITIEVILGVKNILNTDQLLRELSEGKGLGVGVGIGVGLGNNLSQFAIRAPPITPDNAIKATIT
jgi:hypothetical protein